MKSLSFARNQLSHTLLPNSIQKELIMKSTHPKKSHQSLIAVALAATFCLCIASTDVYATKHDTVDNTIIPDGSTPAVVDASIAITPDGRTIIAVSFTGDPIPEFDRIFVGFIREREDTEPVWYSLMQLLNMGEVVRITDDQSLEIELSEAVTSLRIATNSSALHIEAPVNNGQKVTATLAANVKTCRPQCTDFVAEKTRISFAKCWGKPYGDAGLWYAYAKKCGFSTASEPKSGAIMEFSSPGHVLLVTSSKLVAFRPLVGRYDDVARYNVYEITISDTNWDNACGKREQKKYWIQDGYAYTAFDAKTQKTSGTKYKLTGFITRW